MTTNIQLGWTILNVRSRINQDLKVNCLLCSMDSIPKKVQIKWFYFLKKCLLCLILSYLQLGGGHKGGTAKLTITNRGKLHGMSTSLNSQGK